MDNVCCERLNVKLRNAEKHDCAILWHILPLLLILMLQFKFRSTKKVHSSHVTVKWMHGQDESNRSVFYSACRCCQCWHVDRLFGFRSSVLPDKSGQNSSLAFSLHWSGRPHLSSGSKYSCSVFKERYKNMPWTRFPFTCVVSCSIGLGTQQKHGGFRQSCCEPGNKLIGNRLIWLIYQKMKMRQGICRTCWFSGAFRLQGSLNIWNAEGIMIKYELLTSTKWRNAIEFEDSTLFKTATASIRAQRIWIKTRILDSSWDLLMSALKSQNVFRCSCSRHSIFLKTKLLASCHRCFASKLKHLSASRYPNDPYTFINLLVSGMSSNFA